MMKHVLAVSLILMSVAPALSQDHSGHQMPAEAAAPSDPAAAGYKAAMDKMMTDMMNEKPSGNADVDFVRGMIPITRRLSIWRRSIAIRQRCRHPQALRGHHRRAGKGNCRDAAVAQGARRIAKAECTPQYTKVFA